MYLMEEKGESNRPEAIGNGRKVYLQLLKLGGNSIELFKAKFMKFVFTKKNS